MGDLGAEIKRQLSLETVLAHYKIDIASSGSRMKACCPFHEEKTPSFHVNPEGGFYKCFGCGKGGDIFTFVQDMEGISFKDALQFFREVFHVNIPDSHVAPGPSKKTLTDALTAAARWSQTKLFETQEALGYMLKRGFTEETLDKFGIGYVPQSRGWEQHLLKQGFTEKDLIDAGILNVSSKSGQPYPAFRDRILFPFADTHGVIRGFGGRALHFDKDKPENPKYSNTRETSLFKKGDMLYGIETAVASGSDTLHIVEGYTDRLMACQYGLMNFVALASTELTDAHTSLIRRSRFKHVVLGLDPDAGGLRRVPDAVQKLRTQEIPTNVLWLPDKDLDEVLLAEGADAVRDRFAKAGGLYEFLLDRASQGTDIAKLPLDERDALLERLMPSFDTLSNVAQQKMYLSETARKLGLSPAEIWAAFNQYRPRNVTIRAGTPREELHALSVMLHQPTYAGLYAAKLTPEHFTQPEFQAIFNYLSTDAVQKQLHIVGMQPDKPGSIPLFEKVFHLRPSAIVGVSDALAARGVAEVLSTNAWKNADRVLIDLQKAKMSRDLRTLEGEIQASYRKGEDVTQLFTKYVYDYEHFTNLGQVP